MHWSASITVLTGTLAWLACHGHAQDSVPSPPKIVEPDGPLILYYTEKTNVTIPCRAEGVPQPTYKWRLNGTDLQVTKFVSYDAAKGHLVFTHFSLREEGTYMCVATNRFDTEEDGKRDVSTFSPPVTLRQIRVSKFKNAPRQEKKAKAYSHFKLDCSNQGDVVANDIVYKWYRGRETTEVSMDGGRLFIDKEGDLHFSYVLPIDASDASSALFYVCGVSSAQEKIVVLGNEHQLRVDPVDNPVPVAPQLQHKTPAVNALRFSKAQLECVFSGYDPKEESHFPVTHWYDEGGMELLMNDTKYKLSEDKRVLVINDVQEEDEKNYYCEAENSAGKSEREAIFLDVTSDPIFQIPDGQLKDQTVPEHEDAVFHCDARSARNESQPDDPIWYINGVKFGRHNDPNKFAVSNDSKALTIKSVKKATDVMCVACEVKNHVGTTWGRACLRITLVQKTMDATMGHTTTKITEVSDADKTSSQGGEDAERLSRARSIKSGGTSSEEGLGIGPLIAIGIVAFLGILAITVVGVFCYYRRLKARACTWKEPEEHRHVYTACPGEEVTKRRGDIFKKDGTVVEKNGGVASQEGCIVRQEDDIAGQKDGIAKQGNETVKRNDDNASQDFDMASEDDEATLLDSVMSCSSGATPGEKVPRKFSQSAV